MSDLTTKTRKRIPTKEFGLPEERKYPLSDKAHARNAKARASEEYHAGKLSKADEERVDRKANEKLYGKHSAEVHGKALKEHEQSHWG